MRLTAIKYEWVELNGLMGELEHTNWGTTGDTVRAANCDAIHSG